MSEHTETTADINQPASQPSAPSTRRLTRRDEGKVVAGVASGLGDYFGVDPVIFRILFVVLAVAGGAGFLLYALAWVLIPSASSAVSVGERALGRAGGRISTVVGIALLAAGAVWLVSGAGIWDPGIVWAIALIAIGVILLKEDEKRAPPPSGPPPPPGPAAGGAPPDDTTTAIAPPPAMAVARPPKQRSYLGRLTIGIALLVLGATSILDNLGAFDASIEDYIALGVATIGAGLIVGAWRGRSRGLIVLGILLLPLLFVASLVDVPLRGGVGDRVFRPLSAAAASGEYRMGAGEMRIDLTSLGNDEEGIDVIASIGAGTMRILVPEGRRVTVDGHAGAGRIEIFGRADDGVDVDLDHSTGNDTSTGEIHIDIDIGLGEVTVQRG
jgi:phage shock protein PspC (stress-responsive transcriptional regulator)